METDILHLLQQTAHFFREQHSQAYLVGGSVRNLLFGETCVDWDIVTEGDAPLLACRLANALGGFFAPMHEKASRVVVKREHGDVVLDIAPLHGNTIEADLSERDFTINAIALPLDALVQLLETGAAPTLIDPFQGASDLAARTLRVVSPTVFQHDPLRLLRAVRFRMRYALTLDPQTDHLLKRDASLLPQVAPERIHDELYLILSPNGATERLRFLDEHGLLTVLIPEFIPARGMLQPGLHHWDVFEHSLEAVAALERLAATLQQSPEAVLHSPLERNVEQCDNLTEISILLHEAQEQGIFQFDALTAPPLKLAALLHDIGKTVTRTVDEEGAIRFYGHPQAGVPLAQQIMKRLHTSTRDSRLVQQVCAHHMRPGQLSYETLTPRAIRRYFVDLGHTGIYVALISLSDHLAMRGPEPLTAAWTRHLTTVRHLLARYIRERERVIPPRLIQANELIQRLNIAPGPLVGQLLEAIAEAQAEGNVHSKDEALWLAEELLQHPT